jgi:UDP-N-acetylmuramate: L-alanyl-gamma-D-glutamyl-meso-diaminopimelate ligase
MATLCAMLAERGHRVRGSDQDVYPPMSDLLRERGILLLGPYAAANLDPEPDLVVVGNAIHRENPEMEAVLDRGLRFRSFPELLREEFLEGRHAVVIAGTHGKTTTTAMTGVALTAAGLDPSVLVGGHVLDLGGSHRLGGGPHFVLEGDEYDTAWFDKTPKFLKYLPRTLVVGNLEYDHADIYESLEAIELQFRRLVRMVPGSGLVLVGDDSAAAAGVARASLGRVETFGLAEGSRWRAVDLDDSPEGVAFTVLRGAEELGRLRIPFSGRHEARNALAALAVGCSVGAPFPALAAGLAGMRGVKRRLERRGEEAGVLVYDDFAHHPTAIRLTLEGLRRNVGNARVLVALEPRSNTMRAGVHIGELGPALIAADRVWLMAGDGIDWDPQEALAPLDGRGRVVIRSDDLLAQMLDAVRAGDHVVFMSNGGFDSAPARFCRALQAKAC